MNTRRATFIILFILGAAIRFIGLNQTFWLDEATTAQVVQKSFSTIISIYAPHDFHPPLYYSMLYATSRIIGTSEIALRLPSVIFSLLTGYLITRIVARKYQFLSAALFLFNPLSIYYSQEARMYMMATFLTTALLYQFIRIMRKTRFGELPVSRSEGILFDVLIILSLLTYYGTVFFIGALIIYLAAKRKWRALSLFIPACLGSAFILAPLVYQQVKNAQEQLQIVLYWKEVLGTVGIKNLLLIPLKMSTGRISWFPKWTYFLSGGLFTLFVWYTIFQGALKRKSFAFILMIILVFVTAVSFVTPMLQYFRLLYLLPIISMLLSFAALHRYQKAILLGGFLLFSFLYLFFPQFHREDWRSLVTLVPAQSTVYMVFSSSDPVVYYLNQSGKKDVRVVDIRRAVMDNKREIIVIPYSADIYGISYRTDLINAGYSMVKEGVVRGLTVEWWQRAMYAGSPMAGAGIPRVQLR